MKDENKNKQETARGSGAYDMIYCPECGAHVIHESGCAVCPSCGWGLCG